MSNPLSRVTTRVAYGASQLPRIAWNVGHSDNWQESTATPHTHSPVPDRRRLYADMAILLQQDLGNIEAGLYPLPANHDGSPLTLAGQRRRAIRQPNDDGPAGSVGGSGSSECQRPEPEHCFQGYGPRDRAIEGRCHGVGTQIARA
jgi:hypothetical protein